MYMYVNASVQCWSGYSNISHAYCSVQNLKYLKLSTKVSFSDNSAAFWSVASLL